MKKYYGKKGAKKMMYTYKKSKSEKKQSLTIRLNADIDINSFCQQIKNLYPSVDIIKKPNKLDDMLLASESSFSFWDNDTDDEVWNNV